MSADNAVTATSTQTNSETQNQVNSRPMTPEEEAEKCQVLGLNFTEE